MSHQIESCRREYRNWPLEVWLHELEIRHKEEIQLGLSRITAVARRLSLLQPEARIITVAGTNGKGSTVAALQYMYLCAGYQVGTYTSPHLEIFNERITVNGVPVSDHALVEAFSVIEEARADVHLTYFEVATLAALYHFNHYPLDVIILEVGLGGRLDATNIIDNDLAIITTIDFDHQNYLGHTLDQIGHEKAGILRPGKPFIYADKNPPASVMEKARQLKCLTFINGEHYQYQDRSGQFELIFGQSITELDSPSLHGNAVGAAIMAAKILHHDLPVAPGQLREGLSMAKLPGRLQLIDNMPHSVLLDVAHNAQAAENLAKYIAKTFPGRTIHAVFSALSDKNIPALIAPLKPLVNAWYAAQLQNQRASTVKQLELAFATNEIYNVFCHNTPLAAYQAACEQLNEGDLIVIYGSFFTVSSVLPAIRVTLSERN
ncbi:bifunctional folylpolyglutamate synthase/dihydrofolate synthase [Legionella spiritensis]|uniref:Dihydrofolate synthase/folylpolyglutamate synthase n=1 Tax=Legionella spiritensis TaxID=452 RepID=A0A0W0Z5C1_LEGSP|nr:folylpolyglutamate synthase/dihydrofolate synthase family protein [Legionella spiritensis]KTD64126.1 bifunctional protein FolC [Legionella spiritensis]SNV37963.1 folylpolyglutamate synthase [Legionella spiritensis]